MVAEVGSKAGRAPEVPDSIGAPKRIRTSDLLIGNQIPIAQSQQIKSFRDPATTGKTRLDTDRQLAKRVDRIRKSPFEEYKC